VTDVLEACGAIFVAKGAFAEKAAITLSAFWILNNPHQIRGRLIKYTPAPPDHGGKKILCKNGVLR
jgi:hypothetical protein